MVILNAPALRACIDVREDPVDILFARLVIRVQLDVEPEVHLVLLVDHSAQARVVAVRHLEELDHLQRHAAAEHRELLRVLLEELVLVWRYGHRRRRPLRGHVRTVVALVLLARPVPVERPVAVFLVVLLAVLPILILILLVLVILVFVVISAPVVIDFCMIAEDPRPRIPVLGRG